MLKPKPEDDPHDIIVVEPEAVQVAPVDAPSAPVLQAARPALGPQSHTESDFASAAAVPAVDTTFRPAVHDVLASRRSAGGRALRAVAALLLTACIGGAAVAWNAHGEAAQRLIAEWAPLFARSTSPPSEKTGLSAQPTLAAAQVDVAGPSAPQPAAARTEAAAPAADAAPAEQAPSLETMARDLANAGQEIEALKASIEQLKASQQQLVAMVSEKNSAQVVRPKRPAPPRPVAALAPARRPMPPFSPPPLPPRQAIAAPPLAPAPYVPRRTEPISSTEGETFTDPELMSVPRPPMPLR